MYHISFSPITGGEGNIEFLIHLRWEEGNEGEGKDQSLIEISHLVGGAHNLQSIVISLRKGCPISGLLL